jgi:hypothetical protein
MSTTRKKKGWRNYGQESAAREVEVEVVEPSTNGNRRMDIPSGGMPDGIANWNFYDAVNFSPNRASRPFFAVDSKATLTTWSRSRALALARWAYINVHFVKGAVDLMARLTVGTGFSPHTIMPDKGLAKAADDYYREKTKNLGFMHGESMDELLIHDSRCMDVDGDLGYVMTEDENGEPKLQLIEGHRIKNGEVSDPTCRDGVWVDRYGRRVAFNIALPEENKTRRIEAKDFIYLAEHNRPDELRSMTNLIHALAPLQDLYEYLGFTMQTAKKNAEIAAIIETPTPNTPPMGPTMDQLMAASQPASNGQPAVPRQVITREMIYGSGGKIPILRPGEKLNSFEPKNPGPGFDALPVFIIRGISAGYGVPFEVLWNPEAIGGANTRLITALLRARLVQRRAGSIFPKLRRTRFWILSKGIKRGELPFADYRNCAWDPNFSDITVDAGRESKERRANVLSGLDTYTGYFSENGEAYTNQILVRESDMDLQCAAAERLVQKYPWLTHKDALARIAALESASAKEVTAPEGPPAKPKK